MKIELVMGDAHVEGELYDHPVARELAAALPLELVFDDSTRWRRSRPWAAP